MKKHKNIFYILIAVLSLINLFLLLAEIEERKKLVENIKELHCIELIIAKEGEDIDFTRRKCHYYSATGIWQKERFFKLRKNNK